jgi:hypothetical protein
MFDSLNKDRSIRFPTPSEILTTIIIAFGAPAWVFYEFWDIGWNRDALYLAVLWILGTAMALWFRISRAEDDI